MRSSANGSAISLPIADDFVRGWKFDGGSRRQRGWRGSEQPSQRQSRERLAFPRRGGGESCAYPKLSDSRPSSAQRAPVVPRLAAHVPSRERSRQPTAREKTVRPWRGFGRLAAGGRNARCEGQVNGGSFHKEMKRDGETSASDSTRRWEGTRWLARNPRGPNMPVYRYLCGCQIKIFRAIRLYSRGREISLIFSLSLFLSWRDFRTIQATSRLWSRSWRTDRTAQAEISEIVMHLTYHVIMWLLYICIYNKMVRFRFMRFM